MLPEKRQIPLKIRGQPVGSAQRLHFHPENLSLARTVRWDARKIRCSVKKFQTPAVCIFLRPVNDAARLKISDGKSCFLTDFPHSGGDDALPRFHVAAGKGQPRPVALGPVKDQRAAVPVLHHRHIIELDAGFHQLFFVRISSSAILPNASSVILPSTLPSLVRTDIVSFSTSRSPRTSIYGTFSSCAARIL